MSKTSQKKAEALDLEEILRGDEVSGRKRRSKVFADETYRKRRAEQVRRAKLAQAHASRGLAILHEDEYRVLREQARQRINDESGPLPGDK